MYEKRLEDLVLMAHLTSKLECFHDHGFLHSTHITPPRSIGCLQFKQLFDYNPELRNLFIHSPPSEDSCCEKKKQSQFFLVEIKSDLGSLHSNFHLQRMISNQSHVYPGDKSPQLN